MFKRENAAYIYIYIYICIHIHVGSVRDVIVTVVGNGHGNMSSNLG